MLKVLEVFVYVWIQIDEKTVTSILELTIKISLWHALFQVYSYMPDSLCFIDSIDSTTVLGSEIIAKPSLSAESQPLKWGFSVLSMFGGMWFYRTNFLVYKLYDVT